MEDDNQACENAKTPKSPMKKRNKKTNAHQCLPPSFPTNDQNDSRCTTLFLSMSNPTLPMIYVVSGKKQDSRVMTIEWNSASLILRHVFPEPVFADMRFLTLYAFCFCCRVVVKCMDVCAV